MRERVGSADQYRLNRAHLAAPYVEALAKLRELPESPVRELMEKSALEWKAQMESRMLAGAWATMHSWAQKMESEAVMAMDR